jgi:uncharacterized membrane-anchored protein
MEHMEKPRGDPPEGNSEILSLEQAFAGKNHALRLPLTQEMHARRLARISAPAQLTQLALVFPPGEEDRVRDHALSLLTPASRPALTAKHLHIPLPDGDFVWECHTEFATYSFIRPGRPRAPFDGETLRDLPAQWIATLPGQIIRGTQLILMAPDEADPSTEELGRLFHADDLLICDLFDGEARLWADFRLHEDGFGRAILRDQGLLDGDATRLLQWFQELGNYRKMALLGLPLAQASARRLRKLEGDLTRLVAAIASPSGGDDLQLSDEMSTLAAELASLEAEASFRLGATQAYASLVEDRLRALRERRIHGNITLSEFTERRFRPAVRTCSSLNTRLEGVSRRAGWASGLIRTRIDASVQKQSRDLLDSMDRRAQLQLRLQQTVEGLSIAAISYYVVSLLHYQFEAMQPLLPLDAAVCAAIATPIVIALLWAALNLSHRRIGQMRAASPPRAGK